MVNLIDSIRVRRSVRSPESGSGRGPMHRPAAQPVHASESGAAAATATTPIAALMAGHVLRDGELVILILRPSRWFILLSSLRFLTIVAIFMILAIILDDKILIKPRQCVEAGLFVMVGRLMWAILQWMGRYYILTDMRIVRLAGVFNVDIFDCPLRRVARTLVESTFKERLCRIGSISIIPQDDQLPIGQWQMVSRVHAVHEQIVAAISRAKQGGLSNY